MKKYETIQVETKRVNLKQNNLQKNEYADKNYQLPLDVRLLAQDRHMKNVMHLNPCIFC